MLLHPIVLYCIASNCAVLSQTICIIFHYIVCIAPRYISFYCIILHIYSAVLHCTAQIVFSLHCAVSHFITYSVFHHLALLCIAFRCSSWDSISNFLNQQIANNKNRDRILIPKTFHYFLRYSI